MTMRTRLSYAFAGALPFAAVLLAIVNFGTEPAKSQTYPTQTPSYVPAAVLAPATLSAPGTVPFTVNGLSTVSVRVAGTCTALAATVQGTNQRGGTPAWTNLQLIPVAGGQPAVSIGGTGFWKVNVSGLTAVRVNASALSAACVFSMAGSSAPDSSSAFLTPAGYPLGGAPITGIGAGTTGAVVGTLAAVATKTTYICGVDVSAIGGTAAVGPVVIAGLVGGSFTYQMSSTAAGTTLSRTFTPCIPASDVNVAITATTTADGTATAVNVNSWGYQL